MGSLPQTLRLISPYDLDARYSEKRGKGWGGYKARFTETCSDPADVDPDTGLPAAPNLITNVAATEATVPDAAMTGPVHDALQDRDLLPGGHAVDAGYTSADLLLAARARGITLIGPLLADTSPQARTGGYTAGAFTIDRDSKRASCPQGATSVTWSPCTQRGTDQDDKCPRVGSVVDPVGITARVIERDHPNERQHAEGDADRHHPAPKAQPGTFGSASVPRYDLGHEQDHQRPDQIELFFDGQRPHVAKGTRRRVDKLLDVGLARRDEMPVGDIGERRQTILRDVFRIDLAAHEERVGAHRGQHQEQRGKQPPRSAPPERRECDAGGSLPLVDEQTGDEETAEDEEQVDAQEPARRDARGEVVQDDRGDRHASQAVERPEMKEPRRARGCHGRDHRGRLRRRFAVEPDGPGGRLGERDSPSPPRHGALAIPIVKGMARQGPSATGRATRRLHGIDRAGRRHRVEPWLLFTPAPDHPGRTKRTAPPL